MAIIKPHEIPRILAWLKAHEPEFKQWLSELQIKRGQSSQLANRLGISADKMSKTMRQGRTVDGADAIEIMSFFGVAPPGLQGIFFNEDEAKNDGDFSAPYNPLTSRELNTIGTIPSGHYIPILGYVEAGMFKEMTETLDEETIDRLPFVPKKQFAHLPHFAHIVRGDSMNDANPPLRPGDIVISVDWVASGLDLRNGMLVVVERLKDGGHMRELTVKEVEIVRGGVNLVPRSTNPRHQPIFIPRGHFDDGVEVTIKGRVVTVQQDLS